MLVYEGAWRIVGVDPRLQLPAYDVLVGRHIDFEAGFNEDGRHFLAIGVDNAKEHHSG